MSIFPEVTGTEEEVRGILYRPGDISSMTDLEPHTDDVLEEIYDDIGHIGAQGGMLHNGGRAYHDGRGLEICTADCTNVDDTATRIRSNSELTMRAHAAYLSRLAVSSNNPLTIIIGRRVINERNTTWACHDNLSLNDPDYSISLPDDPIANSRLWYGFLRSRVFVTGAGLVRDRELRYSQKFSVDVPFMPIRDYKPRMLRLEDDPLEQRLEIACNDINLKDWACKTRLGGAVLLLAASLTPLGVKLLQAPEFNYNDWGEFTNKIEIDEDHFSFKPTSRIRMQLAMQRTIFSTILEELETTANEPLPPGLRKIGEGILSYCNDFEKVINNEADLSILTSRADWAEKTHAIRRDILKDPESKTISGRRTLYDTRAQYVDNAYDRTILRADKDGAITRIEGYGIRKARQQTELSYEQIENAMYTPPSNTRAARRVALAKKLGPSVVLSSWGYIETKGSEGHRNQHQVSLYS